jgi:hypothetical protein
VLMYLLRISRVNNLKQSFLCNYFPRGSNASGNYFVKI